MIGRLSGTISSNTHTPVIVDVGGVGYLVHVTEKFLASVELGKRYTLAIHTHVREDALDLYGFKDENELVLFDLLLTVSGIGPKTALMVVDRGAVNTQRAVSQGDVDFFTTIPRLGKKNAQKIIIELKNKLGSTHDLDLNGQSDGETKQMTDALLSMGFKRHEIAQALEKINTSDQTLEQKMRQALKLLGR